MTLNLRDLDSVGRLLFAIPLAPLQGHRFQPTGFPGLGAATFSSAKGEGLLVESAQSMANRLERAVWDDASQDVVPAARGISHVTVKRADGSFLTDTILEAHRLNSPYLLETKDKAFFNRLKSELGGLETGPVDRRALAQVLLKLDIGSLLHGVFLAKKELAGGRLRVARAISAFIEADGARVAPSGGVKNDHVNPSGDTKSGFGNVPFSRDEFTAERITLYFNLDLSQIRGYALGQDAADLLVTLALYKLRRILTDGLRLRTACDLAVADENIAATMPKGFALPGLAELETALRAAVAACQSRMQCETATFADKLEAVKDDSKTGQDDAEGESDQD